MFGNGLITLKLVLLTELGILSGLAKSINSGTNPQYNLEHKSDSPMVCYDHVQ